MGINMVEMVQYECDMVGCDRTEVIDPDIGPPDGWISGEVIVGQPSGDMLISFVACRMIHVRKALQARIDE